VDIPAGLVHRFEPDTGADSAIQIGQDVGAVALRSVGGLVMALRSGFAFLDESSAVSRAAGLDQDDATLRLNDARCDSRGRLWAGTVRDDFASGVAALYRLDPDLRLHRMLDGVTISNGLDWSPDGSLFYYADSATAAVDAFDYDLERGRLGGRHRLLELPDELGMPDGLTVDADGFLQSADGGTLFLDEVADLPLHMQVRLLRAIQEKRVRKVGSTQEEPADVRIISATNQSLATMVEAGRFRRDLYYRLNVVDVTMPPLRECREDIPLMATALLERLATDTTAAQRPRLKPEALEALSGYDFPGNIRELENILERALALSTDAEIGVEDLRLEPSKAESEPSLGEIGMPLPDYLDSLERKAITDALAKTGFNRTAAAKLLGITFRQLRYRMQRLGIKED